MKQLAPECLQDVAFKVQYYLATTRDGGVELGSRTFVLAPKFGFVGR